MSEWQPIETAPKDGTLVLLYGHDTGGLMYSEEDRITIGSYDEDACSCTINGERDTGWRSIEQEDAGYAGETCMIQIRFTPSHWMPLPETPAEGKRRGLPVESQLAAG